MIFVDSSGFPKAGVPRSIGLIAKRNLMCMPRLYVSVYLCDGLDTSKRCLGTGLALAASERESTNP